MKLLATVALMVMCCFGESAFAGLAIFSPATQDVLPGAIRAKASRSHCFGRGEITVVPEPTCVAFIAAGYGCLLITRRSRSGL